MDEEEHPNPHRTDTADPPPSAAPRPSAGPEHGGEPPEPGMMGPARALTILVSALVLGSLFNAQSLSDSAQQRAPGWKRDVATSITDPLLDVSRALRLDRPAEWIADIRDDDGPVADFEGPRDIFVPTPDDPALLWITGDSLTGTVGPAVVRAGGATDVIEPRDEVVYSSGLTRRDFFDWPQHLARGLADDPADIVVFMVGANDAQPILTADGWVRINDERWRDEYRLRVAETMEVLVERTTTAYWVGQPITRSETHSANVAIMNRIFEEEADKRPTIRYVDSWELFSDADGKYSAYLPDASGKQELVREDDGVHLNNAGAERLAKEIMATIALDWEIAR